MQLRQYLSLLRKYAALILTLTLISVGAAYYYSRTIPARYRAEVSLLVGQYQQNTNQSYIDPYTSSNLAQAYTLLVTQVPVLDASAQILNWPGGWPDLFNHVSASASTTGSQLLRISAIDADPHRAKQIADTVAQQVVEQSPANQARKKADSQRSFVKSELDLIQAELDQGHSRSADLDKQIRLENDPDKLKELNAQSAALQSKIDEWQKNYASLAALLPTSDTNDLTILAEAQEPTAPFSPNVTQNVLVAGLAGLLLAGALIFLLEYLDDTIKTGEDAQRELALSTLGTITRITSREGAERLVTWKQPRSPISEAYRVLRTNLRYAGLENPSGALLVTSALAREGKTTTAANLAITIAQSGKRVILLDTDLRRPSIHTLFGLANNVGLSDLFLSEAASIESVIQPTAIEGLRVITSGQVPPNPAELLDSKRMTDILQALRNQVDTVILDSPPVLPVADASIIGARCSGALFVVDHTTSRNESCRRAVAMLKQSNVRVLGVVLNKLGSRSGASYYYKYGYYYYSSQSKPSQNGKRPENKQKRPQASA